MATVQRIISDPRFWRVHHEQRRRRSECLSVISCEGSKAFVNAQQSIDIELWRLDVVRKRVIMRSRVRYEFATLISAYPVWYCDGMFMFRSERDEADEYMVLNPTIRKHVMIRGPPVGVVDGERRVFSLYHDSRDGDYKVVRVFMRKEQYAVYSCRNSSWGEMKDLPCRPSDQFWDRASLDGRFFSLRDDDDDVECFDSRDGTLHRFPRPKDVKAAGEAHLAVLSGILIFYTMVRVQINAPTTHPPAYSYFLLQKWRLKPNIRGSFQNCCWEFEAEYEEEACVTFNLRSKIQNFPEQENLYLPPPPTNTN